MKLTLRLILTLVAIASILLCGLTVLAIVLHLTGSPAGEDVHVVPALMWAGIYFGLAEFAGEAIEAV